MRVRYSEYIPGPAEAAEIRARLGRWANHWNGVCVSMTPVEDTRPLWRRLLDWMSSL